MMKKISTKSDDVVDSKCVLIVSINAVENRNRSGEIISHLESNIKLI